MKLHHHFLAAIMLANFVCFFTACSTNSAAKITMADASVPESEQSLIVVLNARGNWADAMLVYIDDIQLNVPGSIFYIPSGIHTLSFRTRSSSAENTDFNYDYSSQRTTFVRTTRTQTAELQITDTFLPKHTYRMVMQSAANIKMEDITGSVDWLSPQVLSLAPKDGVLTNFANPRGFYVMPVFNSGPYLQYTHQFDGSEAQIIGWTGPNDKVIYAEKGVSGLSPVFAGMFLQGGMDFGWNKIGLTTMAEINLGLGVGGEIYGMGYDFIGLNWGYLFVGELYYLNTIGVGFGYGMTGMVLSPAAWNELKSLPAYDYFFPYLRGEVLFFPKTVIPITIYANYFFNQDKWAFGILANLAKKRERVFPSNLLR